MAFRDAAIQICKNYNFSIVDGIDRYYATGIGDMLYSLLGIKNNLLTAPITFGIHLFTYKNEYYINPLNALEFRLQMLTDLLEVNGLPRSTVQFSSAATPQINQPELFMSLHALRLLPPLRNLPHVNTLQLAKPYIVFHTKIRHNLSHNYTHLKAAIAAFAHIFRTDHTIVLLGEKEMLHTIEAQYHNMQTCYNELLLLSNTNTLIDLTTQCFDILNYQQYKNDVHIIANAVANISFGGGGSFCSAMTFGKCIYAYQCIAEYNTDVLAAHDCHIYKAVEPMIEDICVRFGNKI
jgi:hypothetical protein